MTTQTIDRTAERINMVLRRGQSDAEYSAAYSAPVAPEKPTPRPDLGPNQLAWCRENIPSFETCERQAIESEAHRLKLLGAVKS